MVLPGEVAFMLDYLAAALQCNKTDLLGRIILEEWNRQGRLILRIKRGVNAHMVTRNGY